MAPALVDALRLVTPGTEMRAGLDRMIQAQHGAIVVLASEGLDAIRWGGFTLDVELTPQRLAELAKMDGAIVVAGDARRILAANVELMPHPEVATGETGTRHRAAERTSRQLDTPVIALSEDMGSITLYMGAEKYVLQSIPALLQRANQALATLERYRARLDELLDSLNQLELQDLVTLDEVADALAYFEVVLRIAEEMERYVLELGTDGRLIQLQMDELMTGIPLELELVVRDYCRPGRGRTWESCLAELASVDDDDLWTIERLATALGLDRDAGERALSPKGYRLLNKIPRIPHSVADALIRHFDNLQRLRKASVE